MKSMLQIKHLTITHQKDLRKIVDNFTFSLGEHDKAAIIGEEGNGKSTLLKLMYDSGLVENYCEYTGEIIKSGRMGYLAQELTADRRGLTVYEFFCGTDGFYDCTFAQLAAIARELGLPNDVFYSDQIIGTLSGGESVKLRLAALLIMRPDILLLDEPSNDLDINALEWLERFINAADVPVIYVSHDETLLENTANVIIHLEQVRRKTMPLHTISRCDVLLLDEPTRNFSPLSGPIIRRALRAYGGTIISVSHDRKYIDEVCDRTIRNS